MSADLTADQWIKLYLITLWAICALVINCFGNDGNLIGFFAGTIFGVGMEPLNRKVKKL